MRFIIALLSLCLPGMAPAVEPPALLVVGDSLSAAYGMDAADGWVALLEARLAQHGYTHRVVNASQSGATSRGALALLPRALERHAPELVIIAIGGNDGLRGLPLLHLRANLAKMVKLSRSAGAHVVLPAMRIPPNYGRAYTEQFHDTYRVVAREHDASLVLGFLENVALDEKLMQADRFHPNEAAQPVLLDTLWPAIETALAGGAIQKR